MGRRTGPEGPREPTLRAVMSRHFMPVILAVTVACGLLGAIMGAVRAGDFSATASVTLSREIPRVFGAAEDGADGGDIEQYLQSHVAVLDSREVARRAASILEGGPYSPSPEQIQAATTTTRAPGTQVDVTYVADADVDAVAGANAVIEAYQELMRQRWNDEHTTAIAALNESLAAAEAETRRLLGEVEPSPADDETDLTEEMLAIIAELRAIDRAIQEGQTADGLASLDARRSVLATQVDAFETVFAEQLEGSKVSAAAARLDAALVREASLRERLIQLDVDSRLDGDGVAFSTPAVSAAASSAGPVLSGIAGLVLGAFIGLGIAYWLHGDLDTIESPAEARRLLGYPLLWVVYPSDGERNAEAPSTDAAQIPSELLAGIRARASRREPQVLGLVAADDETTRTRSAVGFAWACADDGMKVLIVDGNLERMAERDGLATSRGLADMVSIGLPIDSVKEGRSTRSGSKYDALGYGTEGLPAAVDIDDLRRVLDTVKDSYDLVIVDLPLASWQALTDDGIPGLSYFVVIEHDSRVKPVKRLMKGFERTEVEPVGFVYAFNGVTDTIREPTHH